MPTATTYAPTEEQAVAREAFETGGSMVIEAGAGTGKTSTLQLLAESRPYMRGLYVAYNKAIQTDAAGRFPSNVECRTAHSLAFRTHGVRMKHRLNSARVPVARACEILDQHESISIEGRVFSEYALVTMAMRAVQSFCRSRSDEVEPWHVKPPAGLETSPFLGELRAYVADIGNLAWDDLCHPRGQLHFTHDHYLKQWAMDHPQLPYDFVLFDEAQDADPCIASVIRDQMRHRQVVMVGDAAQAIYGWRGATDLMSAVEVDHRTRLSRSFRFGAAIAEEANLWLGKAESSLQLSGNPERFSHVVPYPNAQAVLCRSNACTIRELMTHHNAGIRVALVGGGREVRQLAEAALRLMAGRSSGRPELAAFATWEQLVDYAENDPTGSDLSTSVKLIDTEGPERVIAAIDGAVAESRADRIISTAHKAKGREWDSVRISTDFVEPPINEETGERTPLDRAEAMLNYVAVTRARYDLDNEGVAWIHQDANPTTGGIR